jgi:hypothetical protein
MPYSNRLLGLERFELNEALDVAVLGAEVSRLQATVLFGRKTGRM